MPRALTGRYTLACLVGILSALVIGSVLHLPHAVTWVLGIVLMGVSLYTASRGSKHR